MAKRRKKKHYKLTSKGKVTMAVLLVTLIFILVFYILTSIGLFENIDPQIGRFSSSEATINIYDSATEKSAKTYVSSDPNYGQDVAIINKRLHRYEIMVSGVRGWVDQEDIELFDPTIEAFTSYYTINQNNELVHAITQDTSEEKYQFLRLDEQLSFMSVGEAYYSYDGHYFYADKGKMLNDYREGSHANALNQQAYYNYYQFLPFHSKSNLTSATLDTWHANVVEAIPSVLWYNGEEFLQVQESESVNALLIYAIAMNESAFGTSQMAIEKFNLFGYNAIDSDPSQADSFASVGDCLHTYAAYHLNWGYFEVNDERYVGAHLGDKGSGMNVRYASDAYWGEKAASYAYQIDKESGFKDKNNTLVAYTGHDETIKLYREPTQKSSVITTLADSTYLPVQVLETVKGQSVKGNDLWYKIQVDSVLDENQQLVEFDGTYVPYNINDSVAYVHSQSFTQLNQ